MQHNRFPAHASPYGGDISAFSPFRPAVPDYAPQAFSLLGYLDDPQAREEIVRGMLVPPTSFAFGVTRDGAFGAVQAPSGNSGWTFAAGMLAGGALVGLGMLAYAALSDPQPQPGGR